MKPNTDALTTNQKHDLYCLIAEKARYEFSLIEKDFDFLEDGYKDLNPTQFLREYGQKIKNKQCFLECQAFINILELMVTMYRNVPIKLLSFDI